MTDDRITFHYAPQTRAFGTRFLLEELGVPYELHVMDTRVGDQLKPDYLAVNPMGKVPAISHRGVVVTEQAAIALYLGDQFAEAGLAPGLNDPRRGDYLRWMVFYGSCFEPALVDHAMKRPPLPRNNSPYADYETVVAIVNEHVGRTSSFWLGEDFSVADALWGSALFWVTNFGIFEKTPGVAAYIERVTSRPAFRKAQADEAALVAARDRAG
ncbi:glutathione S-transferase family protein [Pleomorphomonas sp. NRK KF1]|uniref:glutathione S-transferase family protein n=1 Tax=Pleomorphomonas sp. NRK KF1 TaxID=2943000 RepID=UPI002043B533|nr:glutathione S-transferase family protein [Pleomorphomonas sp. NRK KF1]MCM5553561.1 glutathione S-transferase family protein [Pleomorphomonas sp. NRK KF1]